MDAPTAPSPFILTPDGANTGIQYAWDSTSIGYLKTCPRLYYYIMIEGWSPKGDNVHLRYGIEIHQCLQEYDIHRFAGMSHREAQHKMVWDALLRTADFEFDHPTKTRKNLIRSIVWYTEKYENDPAQTIALSDGRPAVEVSFMFELDQGPKNTQNYLVCGHLDRIVEYQGEKFIMDRKTTTTTPGPYFFNQFEPNNQMTLYTVASQIILDAPVRGVIIDAFQEAVGFSRHVRGLTYRTVDQLEEWLKDLRYWFGAAKRYATEWYWPMNDTACDKYGGCRFREICSKSPPVRERFLSGNYEKREIWNPLKPR